MANYATTSDLEEYDKEVNDQGVDSWEDQLTKATADILNLIKSAYWPQATTAPLSTFDEANLNTEALRQLTVYWALTNYIYPFLSTDMDGDIWTKREDKYKKKYDQEWSVVKGLPLYDWDEDDSFEEEERRGPVIARFARG
jgi:hypothetical protein